MKKRIVLVTAVILSLLTFVASADTSKNKTRVIRDLSPYAYGQNVTETLNAFTETNEGWDAENAECNVTLAEKINTFPYAPLIGDGSLIVQVANAQSGEKNYISKSYSVPLDLSKYGAVCFVLNCSSVDDAKYYADVEFYSEDSEYSVSGEIGGQGWDGLFVDISDWFDRDNVTMIRLSVGFTSASVSLEKGFEYYVDGIGLADDMSVVNSIRYSSNYYYVVGGEAEYQEDCISVDVNEEIFSLRSAEFAYSQMSGANCLRVKYSVDGTVSRIRLSTKDKNGEYFEESSYSPRSDEGTVVGYLSVDDGAINGISLSFEGDIRSLKIYSIEPYSTYIKSNDKAGHIDTCVINANTEEIIVKGSIGRDVWQEYSQKDLYLFANDISDKVTSESLKNSEYIATSAVHSSDFIFRVGYAGVVDKREFLFKKYTVAVKNDGVFEIVAGSNCITNPESFMKQSPKSSKNASGKGVYGTGIQYMQEVGASDTVIWVDIGRFFSLDSGVGSKYECGGVLYYYNTDYASSIYSMVEKYRDKNISVTLVFVVSDTGNDTMNRLLINNDADLSADYCAYNTSSRQALAYLRAFCEYWMSSFEGDNVISRVVFGDNVALSKYNYNMGEKNLAIFTEEYEKGLRVVYNAVKSYSSSVGVYTYIDDNWDEDLPYDLYLRYDNKAFLESLDECVSDVGDINWGVAQNPYPYLRDDYFSYGDNGLQYGVDADRISFKNINVAADWLKALGASHSASGRDYIIIEKTFYHEFDEKMVTADYVYNCYKALNTYVSAYITDRRCNYNNAMKYIDTSLSLSSASFASEVLGVATWEAVIDGFSVDNIVRKELTRGEIALSMSGIEGSVVLWAFATDLQGWSSYGLSEDLSFGSSFGGKDGVLSVSLGDTIPVGESRGIVKKFDVPYDMSHTPILRFSLNAASFSSNGDYIPVTVVLTSNNKIFEVNGSINGTNWSEIYCDCSDFSGIDGVDEIRILFYAKENYSHTPRVFVSSIEGCSSEYTSDELMALLVPHEVSEQRIEMLKKYLYPILASVILLAGAAFVWRRVK